jgi:ribosome-associated protein
LLEITDHIRVPESEFEWAFVRSGGPGGQNVNKVASKAVLRWNVSASASLPDEIKAKLGTRVTADGDLLVTSQRFRDQERNRQDCLDKLADLIRRAAFTPKRRKPSRPTRSSREKRLRTKKLRSHRKSNRRLPEEG